MCEAKLATVKRKVEIYLQENFGGYTFANGFYNIRYGSTNVTIGVVEIDNKFTLVLVQALVLDDVEESDELYIYIGKFNAKTDFGKLVYIKEYKKLIFGHTLLGDYLDKEELVCAISWVLNTADMIDYDLQKLFGGKRFIDIINN